MKDLNMHGRKLTGRWSTDRNKVNIAWNVSVLSERKRILFFLFFSSSLVNWAFFMIPFYVYWINTYTSFKKLLVIALRLTT